MVVVQLWHPRAADAARLAAADGRITTQTGQCVVKYYTRSFGGRGFGPPRGGLPIRRTRKPARKVHRTPQGRQGARHREGGIGGTPPQTHHNRASSAPEGGTPHYMEEVMDLQGLTPSRVHLLLQEIYKESPHNNDGTHLTGLVPKNAVWEICWRNLAAKSSSWYSTPTSRVGRQFTAVLAAECQKLLNWK